MRTKPLNGWIVQVAAEDYVGACGREIRITPQVEHVALDGFLLDASIVACRLVDIDTRCEKMKLDK